MAGAINVYLETGHKRVFASALEWPGWTRSGKDERAALDALAAYRLRYAAVPGAAHIDFTTVEPPAFEIAERVPGNATTDFGAPGIPASSDARPLAPKEAERICELLAASWRVFDAVFAKAPAELRKGPRGGGRDRDKIGDHILDAESAYVPRLGLRLQTPARGDRAGVTRWRAAILDAIRSSAGKAQVAEKRWPPRYVARRMAWHVLDHAWEIEDRST